MIEGTLIAESLRTGTILENLTLTVRRIRKLQPSGEPVPWTLFDFEADEAGAGGLASAFADALEDNPAWYVDFRSPTETFVVYPGRIFRYPRGDVAGRAEAEEHARRLAIPESQLDWPV